MSLYFGIGTLGIVSPFSVTGGHSPLRGEKVVSMDSMVVTSLQFPLPFQIVSN